VIEPVHLVRILLEASLPVVVEGDLRVLEDVEDLLDLFLSDDAAQTDVRRVAAGYHHRAVVGDDAQGQEFLHPVPHRSLLDLLDDSQPVVRIDDLVADLEFLDFQSLPPKDPGALRGCTHDNMVEILAKFGP